VRARAAVGGVLASLGILLVGWQIGAAATAGTVVTTTDAAGGTTPSPETSPTPSPTPTATPTPTPTPSSDGTYTGDSVGTRFGNVEVAVTISGGTITDVTAVHLTDREGRSVQISNRAAPILQQEVLASQSADVANVSGATYTSQAYLSSLQSALDQAGF
jgi:uncharacterized protein with FMN-binding domain